MMYHQQFLRAQEMGHAARSPYIPRFVLLIKILNAIIFD